MSRFKKGDIVRISKCCRGTGWYGLSGSPKDSIGEVVGFDGRWVDVKWDTKEEDGYVDSMLSLVSRPK